MATQSSRLSVREEGDAILIGFVDRNILEEPTIQQIADEISHIVDQMTVPKIVIDFESVEHLSSAALGRLIMINNKIRIKSGQLRLCNIDPHIYEVFVITRLNRLFQIHDDLNTALASLQ